MATGCMLCNKKIGFFSAYGEDILTGKSGNRLCAQCSQKAETIVKKVEMKIPFQREDLEGFSPEGEEIVMEYLRIYEVALPEAESENEEPESAEKEKEIQIGDAIIDPTFEIDDRESESILEKMLLMTESEIEKFLEGIVSDNDTAEGFIRDVLALSDEGLKTVIAEQRELYNNAEWAYILYVDKKRTEIAQAILAEAEKDIAEEPDSGELDPKELERMTLQFQNMEKVELEAIITDKTYTPEARAAAEKLLNE